jgi:iron complex outermembrane receptor protein
MKKFLLPLLAVIYTSSVFGQNTFKAIVMDSETNEILIGATAIIQGTTFGASADQKGLIEITNIPDGRYIFVFSYIGYDEKHVEYELPFLQTKPIEILLTPDKGEELEEVVISSTRTSRTIDNIPTRTEAISGEEMEEKGNMKPGDIRMMLNESTGIQTQQTSATSYNSSIRIQGLDGKYTQILRDGFPLYSGFSGGLSLLQIVPLDLKQVEVIKGASSTLYGGGAIAGLVNLI